MRVLFGSALVAILFGSWAVAGPQGEHVVRGSVQFDRAGDVTTIHASNRAIINYGSFNIAGNETVRFVQPSATSSVLNRITTPVPTYIDGTLQANGIVYIVNRAGVIFGPGSIVDVGQLCAAASSISNEDFLAGIQRFTDSTGSVVNHGSIVANAVTLIGRHVENHGSIVAQEGMITMIAGKDVLLSEQVGGHILVKLEGSAPQTADKPGVENTGTVEAEGGSVLMGAGDMFSLAARNSGSIKAEDVTISGQAGRTEVSGTIDATGPTGGKVKVLGEKVALKGATIDASGTHGGGEVLIGGDYQGANGDVPNAQRTYVDAETVIRADAIEAGNGGKIVVWADGVTGFLGTTSARGGAAGGDGGLIEISGKDLLMLFPTGIDASAPAGTGGTVLFDPDTITIQDAAAQNVTGFTPPGDIIEDWGDDAGLGSIFNVPAAGAGTFSAVVATSTIILRAKETITVASPVNLSMHCADGGNGTNMTFQADDIIVDASITLVGGDLILSAYDNGGGLHAGTGMVDINAPINTGLGGNFTASGINFDNTGGTITTGGGVVDIQNTGDVTIGAVINAGGGGITVSSAAASLTVNFPAGATVITLTDTGGADGVSQFTSNATEAISFDVPTGTLTLNGGGGGSTINLSGIDAGFAGTLDVNGEGGNDLIVIGSGMTVSGAIDGGADNDTLTQTDGGNTWTTTGADAGTVTDVTGNWSNIENLNGGSGADDFSFNAGALSGNVNGGAGNDTFTLNVGTVTGTITGGADSDTLTGD
ncbi:MAG TPA: filamentous hemagglutinin N-terminal domain-containing protein, partial [Phycisphaerae bacterium]|nr:filamentous hemagglutinin N-terminal domain-containing protein [Phycisphaerae bacterium]